MGDCECGHRQAFHAYVNAVPLACEFKECHCPEYKEAPTIGGVPVVGSIDAPAPILSAQVSSYVHGVGLTGGAEDGRARGQVAALAAGYAGPQKCADTTLDSGHRKTFATGSQRDAPDGKGRYDLVSPLALRRLALVLERGAAKYAARNWEKGQPMSQYLNSATRHIMQYIAGQRDEDHLGQAMWNLHSAVHTEEAIARGILPAELADLPDYSPRDPDPKS